MKVTDPAALLRAARKSTGGLKKTGFYDDYDRIPIVEELARQNDMGYHQFILFMRHNWKGEGYNPFKALYDLELTYDQIPIEYKGLLVDYIIQEVLSDILQALRMEGTFV